MEKRDKSTDLWATGGGICWDTSFLLQGKKELGWDGMDAWDGVG